jgi:hypothetical protein
MFFNSLMHLEPFGGLECAVSVMFRLRLTQDDPALFSLGQELFSRAKKDLLALFLRISSLKNTYSEMTTYCNIRLNMFCIEMCTNRRRVTYFKLPSNRFYLEKLRFYFSVLKSVACVARESSRRSKNLDFSDPSGKRK